jgi:hypothetical protein
MPDYFSPLPLRITPAEAERLAGADLGIIKNNMRGQANEAVNKLEKISEKAAEVWNALPPSLNIIKKGHWPIFLAPWNIEEIEMQKPKEKQESFSQIQ